MKVIKVSNDDVLNRGVKAVRRRLGIIRTSFVWSLACGILLVHWSSCAFHYFAYVGAYHGWEGITWMEGLVCGSESQLCISVLHSFSGRNGSPLAIGVVMHSCWGERRRALAKLCGA